jgi:oxygen-dependent protoporphyrinogen oxidase
VRERGGSWRVAFGRAGLDESFACDAVLSALPAYALARLEIGAAGRRPLESLAGIEYSPVASLFLGYRRDRVSHPLDGFGALVPPLERRSALGVVFVSSLFPDRAPAGHVAVNVFVGGTLQPALAALGKDELIARVGADLRDLIGAEGPPAFATRTFWPRAIPQYNLGYGRHLEALARSEAELPGFFVGGSLRDGISLPECLLSGVRLAERAS